MTLGTHRGTQVHKLALGDLRLEHEVGFTKEHA